MSEQEINKCAEVQEQLHFLDDLAYTDEQRQRLEAHLAQCAACRAELETLQLLLGKLKVLEAEPMRAAFTDEAFARVRSFEAETKGAWYKPVMGLAASVVLVGVAFLLVKPEAPDTVPYDVIAAAPSEEDVVQDLRIAFNSPGVLENVGIEIVLPESIGIEGSELHTLSWQTSLYKGKNELRLPLKNTARKGAAKNEIAGEDEFVLARLTHGDKVKEFRVRLVRPEQV